MSWLSAIGSFISSAADVASNIYGSNKSSQIASQNLASQLAWERERATNAHQWEVADLRAAGLNPILSATGGSGAKTSAITPQMPDLTGYGRAGSAFGNAFNQAYQVLTAEKNLNQQDANIALTNSNILKTMAETGNLRLVGQHTAKQIEELNEVITRLRWENSHFSTPTGKAAEDINRYFGNTTAGLILKVLLGLQQDQPNKPRTFYQPLQGGN